ncbi:MAG: DUF3656 domain-containing protein, partial [Bacteroidales bacterium]|nr:DUF3656 domain-containing protein [Bacteroidales bacterium]
GRYISKEWSIEAPKANNSQRMITMLRDQLSKRSSIYDFSVEEIGGNLDNIPLLSAASINAMRREIAEAFDNQACIKIPLTQGKRPEEGMQIPSESRNYKFDELMRSKYCVRYELGLCPRQGGNKGSNRPLYLENNGKRFKLSFDCAVCEMTLSSD